MNRFETLEGNELPYRVEIDNLKGAGTTPVGAICAALSVGHKIPTGMRDGKATARYVFWHYDANPAWVELIRALERNEFPSRSESGGGKQ